MTEDDNMNNYSVNEIINAVSKFSSGPGSSEEYYSILKSIYPKDYQLMASEFLDHKKGQAKKEIEPAKYNNTSSSKFISEDSIADYAAQMADMFSAELEEIRNNGEFEINSDSIEYLRDVLTCDIDDMMGMHVNDDAK